jgi:hypothetical protein
MRITMSRSKAVALSMGCVIGLVAISVYLTSMFRNQRPAVLSFPSWSDKHFWRWDITNRVRGGTASRLTLSCRIAQETLAKGQPPDVGPRRIAKGEGDRELALDGLPGFYLGDTATVLVQVLNSNELWNRNHNHPLTLYLGLDGFRRSVNLKGKKLVGSAFHNEPSWQDGELHLLNLYTRDGDELMIYDIVARIEYRP